MATTLVKSERISCRIAPENKLLLEKAAALRGLSLTDYLISTALFVAREELLVADGIRLSKEDWDAFIKVLENPPEPSPRLVQALARFAEGTFDEEGRYHS